MYRVRSNGNVVSQGEVRKLFPNVSLPRVWSADVCNQLGIDPIFESPTPTTTRYQIAHKNGVEFKNNKWMWAWTIGPVFTDNEEATAAEQESAYIQRIDDEQATRVRADRDKRLAETDWTQLIDSPFSNDTNGVWQAYRQALRDVPAQEGFPWDVTWPEVPGNAD
jgi:hypothetical protein